jgi:hypothetical protein
VFAPRLQEKPDQDVNKGVEGSNVVPVSPLSRRSTATLTVARSQNDELG